MAAPAKSPRRWAPAVLFVILPVLSLGYQIVAKTAAGELAGVPFGLSWLVRAGQMPTMQLLVALEVAAFVAWMIVLSEMPLSAAFPLSAASYLLVIAASVLVFHEALSPLQALGGAAILAGVWLIGSNQPPAAEDRS